MPLCDSLWPCEWVSSLIACSHRSAPSRLADGSDQFSFGLILHELAAGKRAFRRDSAAETMTAIIRDEAEPLPASVPAPVRRTIERCLAKDPERRYGSTRNLYCELRQTRDGRSQTPGPPAAVVGATARAGSRWPWAAAVVTALATSVSGRPDARAARSRQPAHAGRDYETRRRELERPDARYHQWVRDQRILGAGGAGRLGYTRFRRWAENHTAAGRRMGAPARFRLQTGNCGRPDGHGDLG